MYITCLLMFKAFNGKMVLPSLRLFLFVDLCLVVSGQTFHENCKKRNGTIMDHDLCIPKFYKKANIPKELLPFKVNVTIRLTSLNEVSIKTNSYSLYFTTYSYWFDPRITVNWGENDKKKHLSKNTRKMIMNARMYFYDVIKYNMEDMEDKPPQLEIIKTNNSKSEDSGIFLFGVDRNLDISCKFNVTMFPFDVHKCRFLATNDIYTDKVCK